MPTRDSSGRFTKNDGNYNYIPLPSFRTIFLYCLGLIILSPWFAILSEVKDKIFSLYLYLANMIPPIDQSTAPPSTTTSGRSAV